MSSIPPIKHFTVSIFIMSDTQPTKTLLLHHRKLDKWMPAGGHCEEGENPYQTVIREAAEETGLDITPYLKPPEPIDKRVHLLPLPTYHTEQKIAAHGNQPEHYHIDYSYVVRVPEQAVRHHPGETHGIGWFTLDQLADLPMFDNVRHLLKLELSK